MLQISTTVWTIAGTGRGTMGLLMSDTMLMDLALNETLRLLDGPLDMASTNDAVSDLLEDDRAELPA